MKRGISALALVGFCLGASVANAKPYKGAEVYTQAQYQYGRIEVRMRAARGGGILSTFFTYKQGSEMAGASWEEIDVEIFGKSNAAAFQSNILVGNPRVGSEQEHPATSSLADGYHTYTIEWTPTSVAWKLDGVEVRRTTGGQANQLTALHNFRFNLWASDVASWAGAFESSALPQYQYVNWIRYYKYESGNFVLDWSDDFTTLDAARWSKANWTFDGNLVDFEPNNAVVKDGTLVLCLTAEGQTGCAGTVPVDSSGNGGAGGTGGGGSGGAGAGSGGVGGGGTSSGGAGAGGGGAASGGTTSSGGAGSGGVAPAGGAGSATAGTAGAAGASPAAGASSGTAGASGGPSSGGSSSSAGAPSGGGGTTPPPTTSESGCGCAVARPGHQGWLLLALGFALRLRRKRG